MAQDYDHLTLMQKVEVFEHALEHTQGDDLAKILWYKSPNSEVQYTNQHCWKVLETHYPTRGEQKVGRICWKTFDSAYQTFSVLEHHEKNIKWTDVRVGKQIFHSFEFCGVLKQCRSHTKEHTRISHCCYKLPYEFYMFEWVHFRNPLLCWCNIQPYVNFLRSDLKSEATTKENWSLVARLDV